MGLDVAVDDALGVGVLERIQNLREEIQRLPPAKAALLLDILLERDPVEIFHDDIVEIVVEGHVVDLDNISVVQNRDGAGFIFKAHAKLLVGQKFLLEHLDGDRAAVLHVDRAVDNGHAAHADHALNAIAVVDQFSNQTIHIGPPYRVMSTAVTLSFAPASREA